MRKKILMGMIFLIILCLLFTIIQHVLWLGPTPITYFYKEPENSIDVIYLGASNTYAHFNSVLAYDLYGFTTGFLSTDSQPAVLEKYLVQESEKYQTPSLYIIDITKFAYDLSDYVQGNMRKTIDSMKFSKNRINAINAALKYIDIDNNNYMDFYFSFLLYHNTWKNITYENFNGIPDLYKGYLFADSTSKTEPIDPYNWSDNIIELP